MPVKPQHQGPPHETPGMRLAFWSWAAIIAGGLAVMILLPALGR